jgi:hypothetical protein
VLKDAGFVENKSEPCLLSKWDEKDVILIGIHVYDCLFHLQGNQNFKVDNGFEESYLQS